jgi:hypothetical protein
MTECIYGKYLESFLEGYYLHCFIILDSVLFPKYIFNAWRFWIWPYSSPQVIVTLLTDLLCVQTLAVYLGV